MKEMSIVSTKGWQLITCDVQKARSNLFLRSAIIVAFACFATVCAQEIVAEVISNDVIQLTSEYANAVAVDADDRIVVAGNGHASGSERIVLMRYLESGNLDDEFGVDGITVAEVPETVRVSIRSIVLDHQERIVVAGYAVPADNTGDSDFRAVVGRFLGDGTPDPDFSSDGFRLITLPGMEQVRALALTIDERQRLVIAGMGKVEGTNQGFVARLLSTGPLDFRFGRGGHQRTDLPDTGAVFSSVAIDGNGRILAGGSHGNQFLMIRLLDRGPWDRTFGNRGVQVTNIVEMSSEQISNVAIDSSTGKAVAAGWGYFEPVGRRFVIVRYNEQGDLDSTFGVNGQTITNFPRTRNEMLTSMVLDAEGRTTVVGHRSMDPESEANWLLAHYDADGKYNPAYLKFDIIAAKDEKAHAIALDHAGRVVIVGNASFGGRRQVLVGRFGVNGARDPSFGAENFSEDRTGIWQLQLRLRYIWDPDATVFMEDAHDAANARVRIRSDGGPWYLGNTDPNFYVNWAGGSGEETFELSARELHVDTLDDIDILRVEIKDERGSVYQALAINAMELVINGQTVFLDTGYHRFHHSEGLSSITCNSSGLRDNAMWPKTGDASLCTAPQILSGDYVSAMVESAAHHQIQSGRMGVEELKLRQYAHPDVWVEDDHLRVRLKLRYEGKIVFHSDPDVDVTFDLGWDCSDEQLLRASVTNVDAQIDLGEVSAFFADTTQIEGALQRSFEASSSILERALSPKQKFPVCPSISFSTEEEIHTVSFDYGAYDSSPNLMCTPLSVTLRVTPLPP